MNDGAETEAEWISPTRLAQLLDVPLATIYRWRSDGTGPDAHRFGRHLRYHRDAVNAWVDTRAA